MSGRRRRSGGRRTPEDEERPSWFVTAYHEIVTLPGGPGYRSVELLYPQNGLPAGEYGFVEYYCTDSRCDCRNLHLNVYGGEPLSHLATINVSLDPGGFADLGVEEQYFLDPFNPQSEYSPALLELFRENLLADEAYMGRLEERVHIAKRIGRRNAERGPQPTGVPRQ